MTKKRLKKEGLPSYSRRTVVAPGDTVRSKIDDKLTEEKLIDRESVAYANTPLGAFGPGADILGPLPPWASQASGSSRSGSWGQPAQVLRSTCISFCIGFRIFCFWNFHWFQDPFSSPLLTFFNIFCILLRALIFHWFFIDLGKDFGLTLGCF